MVERFLLNNIPTFWLAIGMVLVAIGLTLLGLLIVRRTAELRRLRSQHDVAGFLIAVVGVLYAVLLAFMVVIQWQEFSGAHDDANTEATAVGNLYRDAVALGPQGHNLTVTVRDYASQVVSLEWPYMATHQEEAPNIDQHLNAVWKAVTDVQPRGGTEASVVRQAITDVSTASQARRTRVEDSASELPGPLWAVLLVGGVLTMGFTYFFGLESATSQATMLSTLAVLISLSLFVILTLDLPFTGDVAIRPTALKNELAEFCSYNFVNPAEGHNCAESSDERTSGSPRRAAARAPQLGAGQTPG
jgi:hypothetical protein